ncbi:hypothetical protein [Salinispora pacifica]|uniref:hypothetical protein n=1 Tax=Salinispora pacifica TaxID=351187 RepID=UPI0004B2575F|nr:hypothetical protein [Salinispora pacifica]
MTFRNEAALTGYARAAVAMKTCMHDFCTSTAGSEYTRAFVETLFVNSPEPEPHGEATPDQKVAEVINRASGTVWAQGEAYVPAPAMTAIVAAAAEALDLTDDLLTADVAPADGGVLVLPEPIYHRNLNGQVSGIAAITCTTISSPSGRSWLICGWADRDDPEDPHAARIRGYTQQDPTLLSRLGPYVMTNLTCCPSRHRYPPSNTRTTSSPTATGKPRPTAGTSSPTPPPAPTSARRSPTRSGAVRPNPSASPRRHHWNRPARRRAARASIVHNTHVVMLRRTSALTEPGDGPARWHYRVRFVVRGHWRPLIDKHGQAYRIWVRVHVKGPEDAPLLRGEEVAVLAR